MIHEPRTRSFTLVELLVVIAIIGILVALLVPVVLSVNDDALVAKAKKDVEELTLMANQFKRDVGFFPPDGTTAALRDQGNAVLIEFLDGDGVLPDPYDPYLADSKYEYLKGLEIKLYLSIAEEHLAEWESPGAFTKRDWEPEDRPEMLDPWDNPYQYVRYLDDNNNKLYPTGDLSSTRRNNDLADPREEDETLKARNPRWFDVWSVGKDWSDASDDIGNW